MQPQHPQKKLSGGNPAFLWLFVTIGVVILCVAIKKFIDGNSKDAMGLLVSGAMFTGIPLLMMRLMKTQQKKTEAAQQQQRTDPAPWLRRADWAKGEIAGQENKMVFGCFIGAIIAIVFGAVVVPRFFSNTKYPSGLDTVFNILPILFFGAPAIMMIVLGFRARSRQKKFGQSSFKMSSVSGVIGGKLEGKIEIGARINPIDGFKLRLCCLSITSGGDNKSHTSTLWQDERHVAFGADGEDPSHSAIPVSFEIPRDCNECDDITPGTRIVWQLEARAAVPGVNYLARFDVPVFQISEATVANAAAPDALPMPEIRRDENSKIKVNDIVGGREFFFPAARNPGTAIFTTILFLAFAGGLAAMIVYHIEIIFEIGLGLFTVILFCFTIGLWFKSSRVTIDSSGVRIENRWLFFRQTRKFLPTELNRFETIVGLTSGDKTYQDIKLITRADHKITVGSAIASKPEADWLALEMKKAAHL